MKLTNIRAYGRHVHIATGKEYNIHVGQMVGRCVDVHFYLRQGKRVLVSPLELSNEYKRAVPKHIRDLRDLHAPLDDAQQALMTRIVESGSTGVLASELTDAEKAIVKILLKRGATHGGVARITAPNKRVAYVKA